ncbi:MAG: N-acetylmuramoyl-L-alanine amidase, partial [Isosphaeraceae bacterium]
MKINCLSLAGLWLALWTSPALADRPGQRLERQGDEIVVCGQLFHTGTPVVLWTDPGGYDAYRVERRFVPIAEAGWEATQKAGGVRTPNRYGTRSRGLSPEALEKVRGGGWALDDLQQVVDQFVIHFDACGTSKRCFQV